MIKQIITDIKQFLENHKSEKALQSWKRFVPTAKAVHWVYLADINKMIWKWKDWWFEIVETLWNSWYLEQQLIAAKILGKIWKKDSGKTLILIEEFVDKIDNWAVCDTLATQWVRWIFKIKRMKFLT